MCTFIYMGNFSKKKKKKVIIMWYLIKSPINQEFLNCKCALMRYLRADVNSRASVTSRYSPVNGSAAR